MSQDHIDVARVAHLARLELTPAETEQMSGQLEKVLEYIEHLKKVDVSKVEATAHAFPLVNVMRPDEIRPSLPHDEAMRNAPAAANGLFMVPKIVE
jgi:aspartyl-tRNA(Asn)/glutamyl-tRNA(Gln) amidotransferase subunit C